MKFKFELVALFCGALFAVSNLNAKPLALEEINAAPAGIAKDYYIWRYASERKADKKTLRALRDQITYYRASAKKKFDALLGSYVKKTQTCVEPLREMSPNCQKAVISAPLLAKMDASERADLAAFFKDKDRDIYGFVADFDAEDRVERAIKSGNAYAYLKYYAASKNKDEFLLAYKLGARAISNLNDYATFKKILEKTVILEEHGDFKFEMLDFDANATRGENAFWCGINAVKLGKYEKAEAFFRSAAASAKYGSERDKANFWVYLVSKDTTALKATLKSADINMYNLYARELTGGGKVKIVVPTPSAKTLPNYDITDPFTWQRTRAKAAKLRGAELVKFASKFYTQNTLGEYSYIMERAHDFRVHYYPTPFMDVMGTNNPARQALILALARQESRFVPSAISSSYALGMMQFMPFLANDVGKKKLQIPGFDQDDMFKPAVAYEFANYHLDYLEKYLQSPIFIAYAYNGGLGFTKRMITGGKLFAKGGENERFEPFLSMELVPYAESREYAKKVLANYVVYLAILHSNTKISRFFGNLNEPGVQEKFRSK